MFVALLIERKSFCYSLDQKERQNARKNWQATDKLNPYTTVLPFTIHLTATQLYKTQNQSFFFLQMSSLLCKKFCVNNEFAGVQKLYILRWSHHHHLHCPEWHCKNCQPVVFNSASHAHCTVYTQHSCRASIKIALYKNIKASFGLWPDNIHTFLYKKKLWCFL